MLCEAGLCKAWLCEAVLYKVGQCEAVLYEAGLCEAVRWKEGQNRTELHRSIWKLPLLHNCRRNGA